MSSYFSNIENETEETRSVRMTVEEYCESNDYQSISLKAKADAVMFLEFKFKQLDLNTNTNDEYIFLKDFWSKNESNKLKQSMSNLQKEFLFATKKNIIESHKNESILNSENLISLEAKIEKLELYSTFFEVEHTEKYRTLVIYLYYYYLSNYLDLPQNKNRFGNTYRDHIRDLGLKLELGKWAVNFIILGLQYENVLEKLNQYGDSNNINIDQNWLNKLFLTYEKNKLFQNKFSIEAFNYFISAITIGEKIDLYEEQISNEIFSKTGVSIDSFKETLSEEYFDLFQEKVLSSNNDAKTMQLLDELRFVINIKSKLITYANFLIDSSSKSNNGGCYIATMVYGSYNHPQVILLRGFRDDFLRSYFFGRLFIRIYYFISPKIVSICTNILFINRLIRIVLDYFIKIFVLKVAKK